MKKESNLWQGGLNSSTNLDAVPWMFDGEGRETMGRSVE